MPGDFSRRSVNKSKSYSGVLMQQGRVQVDADWNEQFALALHRTQTETCDVIGKFGTPKFDGAFKVSPTPGGQDLFIPPGRYYLDGLLVELDPEWVSVQIQEESLSGSWQERVILTSSWLDGRPLAVGHWVEIRAQQYAKPLYAQITEIDDHPPNPPELVLHVPNGSLAAYQNKGDVQLRRAITYLTQPFYPWPDTEPGASSPVTGSPTAGGLQLADGTYLVFLEAWQREVNALEDPHIREVALGGPDTAERLQTVWQVRLLPVTVPNPSLAGWRLCASDLKEWNDYRDQARTTGRLNAQSVPPSPNDTPCLPPPAAGYQGLENQLYRVEIFQGGKQDQATFVWSRDNAMVETIITAIDEANPNVLTVQDIGKDDLHSFAVNDWVEIVDREDELQGAPRFLTQIVSPAPDVAGRQITLKDSAQQFLDRIKAGSSAFRLRRWDMSNGSGANGIALVSGWTDIEAGVQVQFSQGYYVPGSYWLIPARTITGDIEWPPFQVPNSEPVPQPPLGIARHFCRLGLLFATPSGWDITDCREQFPDLTHLYASDVWYNTKCKGLKDADNVQEALDLLCEQSNLRFHNKYLHGWGVVCGLQVDCDGAAGTAGPGRTVTLQPGYAIDCEGRDILVDTPQVFDVIGHLGTPSGAAPDDYRLVIDPDDNNQLKLVPYAPTTTSSIFKDTVWNDFYQQYVKDIVDYIDGLSKTPAGAPVSNLDQLMSCAINLVAQYNDPQTGGYVYVSIDEHNVLKEFYNHLHGMLTDKTFCAFLKNVRPFPAYPGEIGGMRSLFGKDASTRIRISPREQFACVLGNDNTITLFDLGQRRAIAILTFPGSTSAVVQDVAFSPDDKTLYAIATLGADSMVAAKPLDTSSSNWKSATVPGTQLATLAVHDKGGNVYATAVGKGLYLVSQQGTDAKQVAEVNAIGQMVIAEDTAYVTSNSNSAVTTTFDQVQCFRIAQANPAKGGTIRLENNVLGSKDDDIAAVPNPPGFLKQHLLYVAAGPAPGAASKQLLVCVVTEADPKQRFVFDLQENTRIRFAFNTASSLMMVSYGGTNHVDLLRVTAAGVQWANQQAYPSELGPCSMAYADKRRSAYVLTSARTVSLIPANGKPWTITQYAVLLQYRNDLIDAFLDLFTAMLQYWKDGFCYLLLVDCPACDPTDDMIGLATITVKNNQVYKVCNFAGRRYVKTFPHVEYWLSLVPILPLLKTLLAEFCCSLIPAFAEPPQPPQDPSHPFTHVTTNAAAYDVVAGFSSLRDQLKMSIPKTLGNKLNLGKSLSGDWLKTAFRVPPPQPQPPVNAADVTGKTFEEAQQLLAGSKVTVTKQAYDPSQLRRNLSAAARAPLSIAPGSSVVLVTDSNGVVRYVAPTAASTVELQTAVESEVRQARTEDQTAINSMQNEVAALRTQMASLQATHTQEIASRDAQIAQLTTATQEMRSQLGTVKTLQDQVQQLSVLVRKPGPSGD